MGNSSRPDGVSLVTHPISLATEPVHMSASLGEARCHQTTHLEQACHLLKVAAAVGQSKKVQAGAVQYRQAVCRGSAAVHGRVKRQKFILM
jgi:hypothetical protein